MKNELTPEQNKQLSAWVVQRDSILKEIAINREENEGLKLSNKNLAASNTEIANKIQQSIGRLDEMEKKEEEFNTLTRVENIDLVAQNSSLQTANSCLVKENVLLQDKKESLIGDIKVLSDVHEKVFDKVNGLESLVGGITKISSENATEIHNTLIMAGEELKKIIQISKENVDKTNAVIHELPPIIFNLQRDILERKSKFIKNRNI